MNNFHAYNLRRRFEQLNPGVGADLIDWDILGGEEEYTENLELLKEEYPEYRWEESEPYDQYARECLKEEMGRAGFTFTNLRSTTPRRDASLEHMLNTICDDLKKVLVLMVSERGWGKSTSAKTIISHLKKTSPETIIKAIDVSLSWYNCAPLKHRQYVTIEKLARNQIANVEDCVYEIGELPLEHRRFFLAELIRQDMQRLRQNVLNGEKTRPIVYLLEEVSTYLNSYSLRKGDSASTVLSDFVNIGRNLSTNGGGGLSALMICTAEVGELSPSLRRRARRLYGRVSASGDLNEARRRSPQLKQQIEHQKPYTFTYAGQQIITCRIPDTIKTQPTDYTTNTRPTQQPKPTLNASWYLQAGISAALTAAFILYFI